MHLDPDAWMAGLFGHPVFRVSSIDQLPSSDAWMASVRDGGPAFAYARVDANDVRAAHALADAGFRVVDVTVKFSRAPLPDSPELPAGVSVRDATAADFDRVVEIATTTFRYSRFHLDPLVRPGLADDIKRSWMESYRRGTRGNGCLVAIADGAIAGFLAIVDAHDARVIDLIGVDARFQRRGVGRALVDTFSHRAQGKASRVEVGTQAANVPSVRLYENCGYRFAGAAYALHGHFGGTT